MNSKTCSDQEFKTVDLVLHSGTATANADAFILAWTKLEKQIRKIFTYVLFNSSSISKEEIKRIISENNQLYADNFLNGFDQLYKPQFKLILNGDFALAWPSLVKIRKRYRNKILHGQLTGQDLAGGTLSGYVNTIRDWCDLVGQRMQKEIGFDGLARNSLRKAPSGFSAKFCRRINRDFDLEKFIQGISDKKYRTYN